MMGFRSGRVDTVLASAGTGKTTLLVRRIVEALDAGLAPERVIAMTFTRKAAAEIAERLSTHLGESVGSAAAIAASGVRVGTVNAVCGQLCREFAFALGITSNFTIMDEREAESSFRIAASLSMKEWSPVVTPLAESFGFREQGIDWQSEVFSIVKLAQANGISALALQASGRRSVEELSALLPPLFPSGARLDEELRVGIEGAFSAVCQRTLKGTSEGAAEHVRTARATLVAGRVLPWSSWAKLATSKAAKGDEALFSSCARVAREHAAHPRLRAELFRFVQAIFACAAGSMAAYARFKSARSLVDFEDQETLALSLLLDPTNRQSLRERIGLVVVDEMQDSSPMQVRILNAMADVSGRSLWLGDPKQSIFNFRGTDAALALAAARGAAEATDGGAEILSTSWRSRPGIRAFIADCFTSPFEALGFRSEEVAFSAGGRPNNQSGPPPLSVWIVSGRSKDDQAAGIAGGIAAALACATEWPVGTPTGERPLRVGDVAVLCRGNREVDAIAAALAASGLPVATGRSGLLEAPECELALAAIRLVADSQDRLALAELVRLLDAADHPSEWLEALGEPDPDRALARRLPIAEALAAIRERASDMTVRESVDAVLVAGGVVDAALAWGHGRDTLLLFEAVRGLAEKYERWCRARHVPALLGSFAPWCVEQDPPRPSSRNGDAVQVLTYHRSKGLEWPMVVCCQLDVPPKVELFRPAVEAAAARDWRDPLAGRWIRYWPWPCGRSAAHLPLATAAASSEVGKRAAAVESGEALRLLYVGMTRPRDHLVLVGRPARAEDWLRTLDVAGGRTVELPAVGANFIRAANHEHPARVREALPAPSADAIAPARFCLPTTLNRVKFPPLRLSPSAATSLINTRVTDQWRLGPRIPHERGVDMGMLGSVIHDFFAADDHSIGSVERREMAAAVLGGWRASPALVPEALLVMADRFWRWLSVKFPDATMRREATVHAAHGSQTVIGRLDMLLTGKGWFAIIDHKAFPGRAAEWATQAERHATQLGLYSAAVGQATGLKCRGLYLHMPVAGAVLGIDASTVHVAWRSTHDPAQGSSPKDAPRESTPAPRRSPKRLAVRSPAPRRPAPLPCGMNGATPRVKK